MRGDAESQAFTLTPITPDHLGFLLTTPSERSSPSSKLILDESRGQAVSPVVG